MFNHFTWCELSTFDLSEAKCFYENVFPWEIDERIRNTHTCNGDAKPAAGMHETAWGTADYERLPSWIPYVRVDSLYDMVNLAVELGGKIEIHPREYIRAEKVMGRHALMRDPSGSRLMLYQGEDLGANDSSIKSDGRMLLNELHVDSAYEISRFYERLLGWKFNHDPDMNLRQLATGMKGAEAGSIFELDRSTSQGENSWIVYFGVKNVADTLQKVRKYGGLVVIDLTKENYGFALVQDSQGAFFCVRQNEVSPNGS